MQDWALLESAVAQPEYPYYLTFDEKLAALFRLLVAKHALVDGNKRLALVVLHGTLLVNGRLWLWDDALAEEFVLACAKSAPAVEDIAAVLAVYTAPIEVLRPDTFDATELREALRLLNPRPPADNAVAVEALRHGGVAEWRSGGAARARRGRHLRACVGFPALDQPALLEHALHRAADLGRRLRDRGAGVRERELLRLGGAGVAGDDRAGVAHAAAGRRGAPAMKATTGFDICLM